MAEVAQLQRDRPVVVQGIAGPRVDTSDSARIDVTFSEGRVLYTGGLSVRYCSHTAEAVAMQRVAR